MRVPTRRSEQNRKIDEGPFYVTQAGMSSLQKQLANFERELPSLIAEVDRTKGFGDFSENAEYQDAKHKMRRAYARIASLKDRLFRAVIIRASGRAGGCVQLGSRVRVEINGVTKIFEIVGPYETDPTRGRISHLSPLGTVLMGKAAGDRVEYVSKAGTVECVIIEIS